MFRDKATFHPSWIINQQHNNLAFSKWTHKGQSQVQCLVSCMLTRKLFCLFCARLILWHTDSCWWNFPYPSWKKKVLMTSTPATAASIQVNIQDQKFIQKQNTGGTNTQSCQSSRLASLNYITLLMFNHQPPLSKNWIGGYHCCSHMYNCHAYKYVDLTWIQVWHVPDCSQFTHWTSIKM